MTEVIWSQERDLHLVNDSELGYILSQKKNGVVILERHHGIREIDVILELKKLSDAQILTVSYQDLIEQIIDPNNDLNIDEEMPCIADFNCDILVIRDIDRLREKTITQMIIWENVKRMAESSLIILTGVVLKERIPFLPSAFPEADYYTAVFSCELSLETGNSWSSEEGNE